MDGRLRKNFADHQTFRQSNKQKITNIIHIVSIANFVFILKGRQLINARLISELVMKTCIIFVFVIKIEIHNYLLKVQNFQSSKI